MKQFYLIVTLIIFVLPKVFSQTISYSSGATTPNPETLYWYEYTPPDGKNVDGCSFNWLPTNVQAVVTTSDGTTVGWQFDQRVYLKWANNILNDGSNIYVSVTLTGCATSSLDGIKTLPVNPKYLPAPTFKTAEGSTINTLNVPCYANEITLNIEAIPDRQYYQWELPTGWSKKGSPGVNLFSTTSPTVDVVVGQGISNTTIKAYARVGEFDGPKTSLTITRNTDQISLVSSNPTVYCNSIAPVTYEVTPISGLSYNWSYPANWTCSSGCSTNKITLIPNGSNTQGQSITARGSVVCGGQNNLTNNLSIPINFSTSTSPDFKISGSTFVCTAGTTLTLTNVAPSTNVTWQASPSSLFSPISGTGLNATLYAASSTASGQGYLNFTINGICGTLPPIPQTLWVGAPSITYVEKFCVGTEALYRFKAPTIPGAAYTWSVDIPNLEVSYSKEYCEVSGVPGGSSQSYTLTLQVQLGNCTLSKTRKGIYADCGGGGGGQLLTVFPNPSSDELLIDYLTTEDTEIIQVDLVNSSYEKVYSTKTKENNLVVPVRNLPNGIYFLNVTTKDGVIKRQIMIEH